MMNPLCSPGWPQRPGNLFASAPSAGISSTYCHTKLWADFNKAIEYLPSMESLDFNDVGEMV